MLWDFFFYFVFFGHFIFHFLFNCQDKTNLKWFQIGTPPDKMIEIKNQHPYIVAYGTSKEEIVSFYIEVERHLISVYIFEISLQIRNSRTWQANAVGVWVKICVYSVHLLVYSLKHLAIVVVVVIRWQILNQKNCLQPLDTQHLSVMPSQFI